jgi:hypothetical protein
VTTKGGNTNIKVKSKDGKKKVKNQSNGPHPRVIKIVSYGIQNLENILNKKKASSFEQVSVGIQTDERKNSSNKKRVKKISPLPSQVPVIEYNITPIRNETAVNNRRKVKRNSESLTRQNMLYQSESYG